jgi:hypothetical protein
MAMWKNGEDSREIAAARYGTQVNLLTEFPKMTA